MHTLQDIECSRNKDPTDQCRYLIKKINEEVWKLNWDLNLEILHGQLQSSNFLFYTMEKLWHLLNTLKSAWWIYCFTQFPTGMHMVTASKCLFSMYTSPWSEKYQLCNCKCFLTINSSMLISTGLRLKCF